MQHSQMEPLSQAVLQTAVQQMAKYRTDMGARFNGMVSVAVQWYAALEGSTRLCADQMVRLAPHMPPWCLGFSRIQ